MDIDILRIGRVVEVSGSKVTGALESTVENLYRTYKSRKYAVGQIGSIVKIVAGDRLVFGIVVALRMTEELFGSEGKKGKGVEKTLAADTKWLDIDLFGEGVRTGLGEREFDFQRGVATYPLPGQGIFVASIAELKQIYQRPNKASIHVGSLSQASALPVHFLIDELLGKHFAVLGTTGSGKSCAATVLLRAILERAPKAHIVLFDPHNEYRNAFKDKAECIDPTTLTLPHWLLNFEESIQLYIGKTEYSATNLTRILKEAMLKARRAFPTNTEIPSEHITVDTPVPYKLGALLDEIDTARNNVSGKQAQDPYNKIEQRIQALQQDKRFEFLIQHDDSVKDDLCELLEQYLRIPVSGKALSIIDLSGVPSDVMDVVVAVLCRMIFNFAVWSPRPVKIPVVLVCEEAHRYARGGSDAASASTKQALSRIAKEGRKYGVGLGLVSQRPSELSGTILSQCNTLVALRMNNKSDQEFVQRALPDSVRGLVDMLPILRTQEAFVVGEGVPVPVRFRFKDLPAENRPQSADVAFSKCWSEEVSNADTYVSDVVKRWRLQDRSSPTDATAGIDDDS